MDPNCDECIRYQSTASDVTPFEVGLVSHLESLSEEERLRVGPHVVAILTDPSSPHCLYWRGFLIHMRRVHGMGF
jgi:hypothetical protein